jgi:hypothetical protein
VELVRKSGHKTLAVWAIDCVERVLPYFERKYPEDNRPRKAIEALQHWISTGILKMADVRQASLNAHAAAREVGEDNAACSAARAAGQAVATAHVPSHSIGAANYSLQAIYRAANSSDADAAIAKGKRLAIPALVRIERKNSFRAKNVKIVCRPKDENKMNNKIDDYISKQAPLQKEICQKLRSLILKTFPDAKEEMKWGVPAFADGNYYIVALKDHVNLGFSIKGLTNEDEKLFDGSGKTMRHIEVKTLADIDEKRIVSLLKLVNSRSKA